MLIALHYIAKLHISDYYADKGLEVEKKIIVKKFLNRIG